MEFLIVVAFVGLFPAVIASNKGRSFVIWWLYGALLFIVALPHALLITPDQGRIDQREVEHGKKKCPQCGELVRSEAKICKHCSSPFRVPADEALSGERPLRKCPMCAEWILAEAQRCRYCSSSVEPVEIEEGPAPAPEVTAVKADKDGLFWVRCPACNQGNIPKDRTECPVCAQTFLR